MNFKKINAPSIKELLLSQIEESILSGELKPGDRLPSERELADVMGISKTIVHEGIRDLVQMGFLEVVTRKGVYVADYLSTGNLDTLLAIIKYQGGMPDPIMLSSILDIRLTLETPALLTLAKNHTDEDIEELYKLQHNVKKALSSNMSDFASALFLYRRTIVAKSGNVVAPLIMNAFYQISIYAWSDYASFTGSEEVYKRLVGTTEALKNGDGITAVNLFKESIESYKNHIISKA